ncbi:MAG: hypothetical protein KF788_06550 [Piscinibacter sp.]|nr:hypothetical protein [Piscinibacter sp.]
MATGLLKALGLKKQGVTPGAGAAPGLMPRRAAGQPASVSAADAPLPSPDADDYGPLEAPKPKMPFLDPSSPEMRDLIMKGVLEQAEKDKKAAEQALATLNKQLAAVKAYVAAIPDDELRRASYATIMAEVRKRFPEAAGLSQWVKETSIKVPSLKGQLPSPKALMGVVESVVKSRGAELGWSLSTGKDLMSVNTDRLLAAYMSELPAGVSVKIAGGVVQLTREGAAVSVKTTDVEVDANAGKGGAGLKLKTADFGIEVSNPGWKEFDPQLRGRWEKISDAASVVLKLKAARDEAKLELERKKSNGEEITADLTANFEKREAAFNLGWKKLQERITATATGSEEKITASIAYLKEDKANKANVQAGVDAEVDLKALQGQLKAYYASPSLEAVLKVAAAADKVSARLELTAVKTGVVVTAAFEQALDETKAALEVMLREGNTKVAAELKKKADDLTAKVKLVHEHKDLKLAAELEKTLKEVRGSLEVEYKKGQATLKAGAGGSSTGEVSGKVQIDIALQDGRTFVSEGDKLSFAANVSNKGYKFEVAFSMGEPVDPGSLQDLFGDADRQIKELYRLAGDKGVRSIEDAAALNRKLQEVMAPVKATAGKVKTLRKKTEIAASFGFSIEGEWPAGGRAAPPAAMFGAKIMF